MKRKTIICMLVALCAMSPLTGCGKKASVLDPKNPTIITAWNYYSGAQLESFNDLVKEFNETKGAELGIVVETASEGNIGDLQDNIMAAAEKKVGAAEMPNIFSAYTDNIVKVDEMGMIEDIGSYFTKEEREEYIDSYLKEGDLDHNGGLKIFPVAKATEIFMLNRTDWDKFATETGAQLEDLSTIEGIVSTAEAYYNWTDEKTPEKDDGKAFFGRDSMANYMIIGAKELGVDLYSNEKDGKIVIDLPEETAKKLWDNYYVPFINGYFGAMGKFRSDDVRTGNALCFVGSSASASFFPQEVILSDTEKYPIEVTVLETPRFADGGAYAIQQGAGMAVVKASEAEVTASVEFLKWFAEADNNIRFSVASGYLPVKKEANDMKKIEEYAGISKDISQAVKVSIDTVNSCEMYTAGITSSDIRNILEYSMSDKAAEDREAVLMQMESGMSREEAVALYDTEENFKQWYETVMQNMTDAGDGAE